MKLAIAVDGSEVSQHFGYCEGFQMYKIKDGEVEKADLVENPGHRPGFLPKFLKEQNVKTIISGGMGGSAQKLFNENKIEAIVGAKGSSDDIAEEYAKGNLESSGEFC